MNHFTYSKQAPKSFNCNTIDAQSLAQAELDNYISTQAQAVAPEAFTCIEISFYNHEYYAGGKLIATITYDDDLTQPWVVMVNGEEKHRANTWAKCNSYITWHHKQGTLNAPAIPEVQELILLKISDYEQEVHIGDYQVNSYLVASISFDQDNYKDLYWRVMINRQEIYRGTSPTACYEYVKQEYYKGTLPVQEQLPQEVYTTGNEIMVQIFNECEKFGLELLENGIYRGDEKLGKVGKTNGNWWFKRTSDAHQQRILCDSASDAVWWVSREDLPGCTALDEYLQYRPLEQMPSFELKELLDSAEFVAA
jgi:hypothetical protein